MMAALANRWLARLAAACLVALAATGCAGPPVQALVPLPFHVALIPVEIDSSARQSFVPPSEDNVAFEGAEDTQVQLAFLSEEVSSALVGRLDAECFTRASLLPYPKSIPRDSFFELSLDKQDEYWVTLAKSYACDLIVECTFSYQPAVRSATNDQFMPNVFLFLLGGPFCWFTNDRSYFFDTRVDIRVYDLAATHVGAGSGLAAQTSRLMSKERVFTETTLDFMDRAGKNPGYFTLSVIWPAGLLATQSKGTGEHLKRQIIAQLCGDVVTEIRRGSDELMRAEQLVHFQAQDLKIVAGPDGPELRGAVVLTLGEVDRLEGYRCILGDGQTVEGEFGAGSFESGEGRRRGTMRYTLAVPLPGAAAQDTVRLEIIESRRNQTTRTFTVTAPVAATN